MSSNAVRLKLDWTGQRELQRYLAKTIPQAFEASLQEALLDTAEEGAKRAKELSPVDTGAMRESIRVERLAKPRGNIYYTGIRAGGYIRNPKTGRFVDYASFVEYGTSRQRPQPFMRPAVNWAMRRLPNHFWRSLSRRVEV